MCVCISTCVYSERDWCVIILCCGRAVGAKTSVVWCGAVRCGLWTRAASGPHRSDLLTGPGSDRMAMPTPSRHGGPTCRPRNGHGPPGCLSCDKQFGRSRVGPGGPSWHPLVTRERGEVGSAEVSSTTISIPIPIPIPSTLVVTAVDAVTVNCPPSRLGFRLARPSARAQHSTRLTGLVFGSSAGFLCQYK